MGEPRPLDRREFLRWAVAAGGGSLLGARLLGEALGEEAPPARARAKVVVVTCPDVMKSETSLESRALRLMLEKGIAKLAGKSDVVAAWQTFVRPTDSIAMVDSGTWLLNVPQVVVEVLRGLSSASPKGLKLTYCALDERKPDYLTAIREGLKKVDLSPDLMDGTIYTMASKFHEHAFSSIVMTPTLKSHTIAGVSGVVKHYATMSKTHVSAYHANAMETAGSVLANEFADRRHLVVVDGLRWGRTTQGPQHYAQSLILGTDPVAVDVVALKRFLQDCSAHGDIPPERHRNLADTRYHAGISDPERIDVEEVKV